jgi:hypothetical protein
MGAELLVCIRPNSTDSVCKTTTSPAAGTIVDNVSYQFRCFTTRLSDVAYDVFDSRSCYCSVSFAVSYSGNPGL